MKANYLAGVDVATLLDPKANVWSQPKAETFKLMGTPLGMQPTELIRSSWAKKKIGNVESVKVQAAHNGEVLAFRIEWASKAPSMTNGDNSIFPDGAAIALPVDERAPVITMGATGFPINAWYWRANDEGHGRQLSAEGIGTSETLDLEHVKTGGVYENGHWHVVIVRALKVESKKPVVQLEAGKDTKFGVAIWDGKNQERGGIKAFSGGAWLDLSLEAGN